MWAYFCWLQQSWVFHLILKTMPSCPGLTPMQHFTINLTAGSVECSLLHQWKTSGGGHIHFKGKTFAKSVNTFDNNCVWCLFLNWHLTTLHKQGDNIQPWHTPFPIWNQSVVPCPVLTVASWPVYRFPKRQVRWSGIPISFRIFPSLLWSTQSKALA